MCSVSVHTYVHWHTVTCLKYSVERETLVGANFSKLTMKHINFGDIAKPLGMRTIMMLNKVFWLKKFRRIYGNFPNLPLLLSSKVSHYIVLSTYVSKLIYKHLCYTVLHINK